ncbi:hypothetical protein HPB51_012407 [Rhipicephalus microplus]|uniref:Uncharacterized protein n=1 Tax=Rhipicephalus microplus TaxID=6941 RepID=A0A9J6E8Q7_RHIMP|nr:hypothetical protein HPB51_012407 [Rhipicephalus microplus]
MHPSPLYTPIAPSSTTRVARLDISPLSHERALPSSPKRRPIRRPPRQARSFRSAFASLSQTRIDRQRGRARTQAEDVDHEYACSCRRRPLMARRRGVFGPLALGTALASAVLAAALSLPPASMALTLAPDPESGTEPGDIVGPTPHRPRYVGPCNRVPPGVLTDRSPGYNNFSIVISGNPKKYVPGEAYTAHLIGVLHSTIVSSRESPDGGQSRRDVSSLCSRFVDFADYGLVSPSPELSPSESAWKTVLLAVIAAAMKL